jgi:hypothetical protein
MMSQNDFNDIVAPNGFGRDDNPNKPTEDWNGTYGQKISVVKDSGSRREFPTGAHRDMAEGKGDMFSLPPAALLRLSKHYEAGAVKYGRNNYQKGIPISAFMDSLLRHAFKYLDGQTDEDHLAAVCFNALGALQMEERNPEMMDIETRVLTKEIYEEYKNR